MKKIINIVIAALCIATLVGCGSNKKTQLSNETIDAIENLYSYQLNYSNGVASLVEIPYVFAEEMYNNYDSIISLGNEHAPIGLREYAVTNTVYFDYDTDYSVVWNKNTNSISIEKTDINEREAFKEKQHK